MSVIVVFLDKFGGCRTKKGRNDALCFWWSRNFQANRRKSGFDNEPKRQELTALPLGRDNITDPCDIFGRCTERVCIPVFECCHIAYGLAKNVESCLPAFVQFGFCERAKDWKFHAFGFYQAE